MRLWVTTIGGLLAIACPGPLISRTTSPSESRPRPETSTGHSTVGECEAPKPSGVKDGALLGIYGYELSAMVGFRRQEAFDLAPDERPTDEAGWPAEAVEVKGVAHSRGYGPKLDKLVDGCGYRAFAPNGRMCPSVILPTKTLSQEQVQRLLKTSQLPKSGPILRCGHQYRHSFVFFDRDKRPVGEVAFGFSCGRWSRNDGEMMPEGASDVLAELCRELGLPECPGDEVSDASKEALVELRRDPLPRPSEMFDIDPSTSIAELSVQQRAELCAWRALEESRPGAGLEFRSGRTIHFQTFAECVENFPSCDSALGEVEQTDFSFAPPAMHLRSSAKCVEEWAFGEHRECLWGLTMGSSPMHTQSPASTNAGESSYARRSPGED